MKELKLIKTLKNLFLKIIGNENWLSDESLNDQIEVTGICGSGIIEAIAEMRLSGIVDETGLIGSAEQTGSDRCIRDGRTNSYILVSGREIYQN